MTPTLKQTEPSVPLANSFRVIPKDFLGMADLVQYAKFDICGGTLELHILENSEFSVTNWLSQTSEENEEVLTFVSSGNGNILCMMRFCELPMLSHEVMLLQKNADDVFGIEKPGSWCLTR
jgi:hypothetical protein